MNWYKTSLILYELEKEAGWKEGLVTAILGAVVLVMAGSTIYSASQKMNISETQLQDAMQDDKYVQEAKNIIENGEPEKPFEFQEPTAPTRPPSEKEIYDLLVLHENYKDTVYMDSEGNPTIGIGFNLTEKNAVPILKSVGADYNKIVSGQEKLSHEQIMSIFKKNTDVAVQDAMTFVPSFNNLPTAAQLVLIDMSFNLGLPRLKAFQDMKSALEKRDFQQAAKEMKDSVWYGQTGTRSARLVKMMQALK